MPEELEAAAALAAAAVALVPAAVALVPAVVAEFVAAVAEVAAPDALAAAAAADAEIPEVSMIEAFVIKVGSPLASNSMILLARAVFVHSVGAAVSDSGTLTERSTPRLTSWT